MAKGLLLLDTSIMLEILRIPGVSDDSSPIHDEFTMLMESKEYILYLPLATIVETGNHISHIKGKDGNLRRLIAKEFVKKVKMALDGTTPFKALAWEANEMSLWIDAYPEYAMSGMVLGDLSIIHQYERQCAEIPGDLPIKIWSKDTHLASYSRNWEGQF